MSEISTGSSNDVSVAGAGEVMTGWSESFDIPNSGSEVITNDPEISMGGAQMEISDNLETAQGLVEDYHEQSIQQILELNGQYMSEADRERIANGADSVIAVEFMPERGNSGAYTLYNGKSNVEVLVIDEQQMERSTKHETNHFASKNREIVVPEPDRKGYSVYQTVGTRQSSWFHSCETGEDSEYTSKGLGLNEGLTTMYTNQQLMEISREKGEAAERQRIYSHATQLCSQLESIVGKDVLKEAYYGGNMQNLENKIDSLAGEKSFESLRECLDRAVSKKYDERAIAMKEAQTILAKMYEMGEKA